MNDYPTRLKRCYFMVNYKKVYESPAVSAAGAQNYKGLCLGAKRQEKRLNEPKKKQQYLMKTNQFPPKEK